MMHSRPKVLVIDDSPMVRTHLSTVLQGQGCQVMALGHPYVIMTIIRAICRGEMDAPSVAFIGIDLKMGQVQGYDLCLQLKAAPIGSHLTIFLISRHAGRLPWLKARIAGATTLLVKPLTDQCITQAVFGEVFAEGAERGNG